MRLTTSDSGINLIKEFEGCKLVAYADPLANGKPTVGYGHTGSGVVVGAVWTQDQCDAALKSDVAWAENVVNTLVAVYLSQPCFDALVDFVHNVGSGNFATSTLLKYLNDKAYNAAANEFLRWCHAGTTVVQGLLRRREAEANLFRSGIPA